MYHVIKIFNIEQLKYLFTLMEQVDCTIKLGNSLRSSKSIWYDDIKNVYIVYNEIDDSEDVLTEKELFDVNKTLIGKAIDLASLVMIMWDEDILTKSEFKSSEDFLNYYNSLGEYSILYKEIELFNKLNKSFKSMKFKFLKYKKVNIKKDGNKIGYRKYLDLKYKFSILYPLLKSINNDMVIIKNTNGFERLKSYGW